MKINWHRHNWLVNRIVKKELKTALAEHAHGRLLDIGCGDKPFIELANPYVAEHVGLDHAGTGHDISKADLVGTVYDIPAKDASFDSVLCTAVLEHLEEPLKALREIRRVLKPGGKAVLTVPLFWHLHEEPRDFFRYTKYGLAYLFKESGFTVNLIKPLSGFWVTFMQELAYYVWNFRRTKANHPLNCLLAVFCHLIQLAGWALYKFDRSNGFTWMYLAVIQKHNP